jgi:vancomycin resistance protein YoaR
MYTVSYLPLGLDATVNWGTIDFKFTNDSEYPIKIISYVSGSHLNVQILGTKLDDNYVEMKYVVVSSTQYEVVEQEDPRSPKERQNDTPVHTGYVVDTYNYIMR